MTQKKESALGRGLDALIRRDAMEEVDEPASETNKETVKQQKRPKPKTHRNNTKTTKKQIKTNLNEDSTGNKEIIREDLVDSVLIEVHKNPRISLWSARSAAVLRLLKKTKPEFSISKEASALIEDAVKDKYPDLWDVFENKEL